MTPRSTRLPLPRHLTAVLLTCAALGAAGVLHSLPAEATHNPEPPARLFDLLEPAGSGTKSEVATARRARNQRPSRAVASRVERARSVEHRASKTAAQAAPAKAQAAPVAQAAPAKAPAEPAAQPASASAAPQPAAPAPAVPQRAAPAPPTPSVDANGDAGTVFATVAGQEVVLPADAIAVGFHESSNGSSLAMSPVGTPLHNQNAGRIKLPPASAPNRYFVLPTRNRSNGPTTAVDIRVDQGTPLASVVDGTVTAVDSYQLYGRTPDQIVEIVPTDRPELKVRMLHIDDVKVQPGDHVEAGETVVAGTSRQLPFASQIDRFSSPGPHVHVEVNHQPVG